MQEFYTSVDRIGNTICERYINEKGQEQRREIQYSPSLFIHSKNQEKYKDLFGNYCHKKQFKTMGEANKYLKDNSGNYEVLGMEDFELAYISDNYSDRKYNIDENMKYIRIANLDIECPAKAFPYATETKYPIKSIVHYDNIMDEYHFFGTKSGQIEWSRKNSMLSDELLDKVVYHPCDSEKTLLTNYILFWKQYTPNATTGWNTESFDIPYIYERMRKVLSEDIANHLSPWKQVKVKRGIDSNDNEYITVDLAGVASFDYLKLYRKFTFKTRPNYRLDTIGHIEVDHRKVEFEQVNYIDFYNEDYQRFGDYNIVDVELVNKIDKKMLLLNLAVTLAYYSGVKFSSVTGTLKPWDAIIFNSLHKENRVVPMARHKAKIKYIGAFVKPPIMGFYHDILSFDLTSLYPSIIRQCNISPETMIKKLELQYSDIYEQIDALTNMEYHILNEGYSASANGMLYTKEFQGVIPREITKVFLERKAHKKVELENSQLAEKEKSAGRPSLNYALIAAREHIQQMVRKIQINSLYGALGNNYFRYYDIRNAEAVTSFGQLAIKWVARDINAYLNRSCNTTGVDYVVYGDTDSVYINFNPLMKKLGKDGVKGENRVEILDRIGKVVEKQVINPSYDYLTEYMNNKEKQMFMDREAIALTGFFLNKKKRYALSVNDMENVRYPVDSPKLKIMGIETQRSSTPPLAQSALKESIRRILTEDESSLQTLVSDTHDQWMGCDYHDISYISSANNIAKYSDEKWNPKFKCPGHLKGVLSHNKLSEQYGFQRIDEGEKVALIKLKEPNRFGIPLIAYPSGGDIPRELDESEMEKSIDRELLYQEKFLSPLKSICSCIDWDYEAKFDLADFF